MKKIILAGCLLLVFLYNLSIFYIDKNLSVRNNDIDVYNSCHKIWSARGIYNSKDEQNSIIALQNAFGQGASGAEFDFYYDVKMDKFIVSHDKPKQNSDGNLIYAKKAGQLLTLEHLFEAVGKGHYFWLDYKNLDRISVEETNAAIARLHEITDNMSIKERLYLEGSNPFRLSMYTDAGFKTILAMRPLPESNLLSTLSSNIFKILYYANNITALTMQYGDKGNPYYGEKTQAALANIPVFLFHVKDDELLLKELVAKKDVRVVLAGRDKSLNRFYINNCVK